MVQEELMKYLCLVIYDAKKLASKPLTCARNSELLASLFSRFGRPRSRKCKGCGDSGRF